MLGILAQSMEAIILVAAVIEAMLFMIVIKKCKTQQRTIHDTFMNIVKGLPNIPDKNSNQSFHDQFVSLVTFLERKLVAKSNESLLIKRNINRQLEKNARNETFDIESLFNVCSAMVQVFPLLGILGTVLALSQVTANSGGSLEATEVTTAFIIAIDTTILGMFCSVIFMLVEARVLASVQRILEDSKKANQFIVSVLS